ncbi:hypothetical protein RND71_042550 [Anisodus tanguticus]|uniref:Uncharacterized protein n=1 Tax=Anisodus tanguticus TaxID=243964 RepID=A0AAE1UN34_9SOLA|nr:hypothetical protein RND71_042550 [Anisodus tanguticus]
MYKLGGIDKLKECGNTIDIALWKLETTKPKIKPHFMYKTLFIRTSLHTHKVEENKGFREK